MKNCLSCFSPSKKKDERNATTSAGTSTEASSSTEAPASSSTPENLVEDSSPQVPKPFEYRELAVATKNFGFDRLIGEGGYGTVYKGILETGQEVAVKLNLKGLRGTDEFVAEVKFLCGLHHRNLVNLVGYCTEREGDHMMIVYEYMPQGSLKDHLFDLKQGQQPLDWFTRMKIALVQQKVSNTCTQKLSLL
ncbi:hypothetical protein LUZ61_006951 [Rhynchospora tenuis]|uniref:Protein kinase domain-containing protein n=1 Tax=Rhynchospora tenuis TaxID=198213 RepID=A0AAD5ZSM4_9POAL|nr:hypothetical protein LUZ61_006951 [Rhynchospora tenuis]